MTQKEINRCEILRMADERKITQKAGAGKIKVTERHFRTRVSLLSVLNLIFPRSILQSLVSLVLPNNPFH
jgi:hypothetical protein